MSGVSVLQHFEAYQKARVTFVQAVAEAATRPGATYDFFLVALRMGSKAGSEGLCGRREIDSASATKLSRRRAW